MKYEYCCKCGCATGRAGAGEDSLYTEHDGPFCEDCFPDAQPKQEQGEPTPLLEFYEYELQGETHKVYRWLLDLRTIPTGTKLYTAPPQQRKPLTDEQIADIVIEMNGNEPPALFWKDLTKAIEAAHGIKE